MRTSATASAMMLLLAACQQASAPATSLQNKLNPLSVEKMQELATNACLCEQQTGNNRACWKDYQAKLKGVKVESGGTACAPVSSEMDCFGEKVRPCIVTGYNINAIQDDIGLCRAEDAQAVEEAYRQAFNSVSNGDQGELSKAHEAGQAAIIATLKRIRRGENITVGKSSDGCV